jgi:hypothetical protein
VADARLLGTPIPFDFGGRLYMVSPRTFEQESLFQVWLEREVLKGIQRHQDAMSPTEYAQHIAGWRQECGSHMYDYGSPASIMASLSPAGMKYLVFLALKEKQPEVDLHLIDRIWDNPEKWNELANIMGSLNDPNRTRPGQGQAAPA